MRKYIIILAGLIAFVFVGAQIANASATSHVLVVDGISYNSYKESGPVIHWETPDSNPTLASFGERNQVWQGNGSEHLPCEQGIHWISNENTLNVSHCLGEEETTTTTTIADTTTTVEDTTTTTTVVDTTEPTTSMGTVVTTTNVETTVSNTVPTELPETGSENWISMAIAIILFTAGSGLVFASRRS